MDSDYDLEELSNSLQKCEPFSISGSYPSMSSIAHNISSSEILSGQREDKGNDKVRLDDGVGIEFHDNGCSSPPRRSDGVTNLNRSNISIKATKGCGKQGVKNALLDLIAKVEGKSRSPICRPARSSAWGSISISKYFEKGTRRVINKVGEKSQNGWVARECGKGKSEQISNGNSSTSRGRLRIKVKLGNEIDQTCVTNMVSVTEIDEEENVTGTHKTNFNGHNLNEEFLDTLPNKELKSSETGKKLDGLIADINQGISFPVDVEEPGISIDNKFLDLGTSPDSEVINVIPEAQISEKEREDFLNLPSMSRKKGNKSDNMLFADTINDQHILGRPGKLEKARIVEECRLEEKVIDGFVLTSSEKLFINKSSSEGSPGELLPSSIAGDTENASPCTKSKSKTHVKNSKSKKGSKVGPELFESPKSQRGNAGRQKGNITKSTSKKKGKEKGASGKFSHTVKDYHEAGDNFLVRRAKSEDERTIQEAIEVEQEIIKLNTNVEPNTNVDVTLTDQYIPPRNAWVLCDECSKWRRIPAVLADSIDETNSRWTCKENVDKDFADCSIPQEKSNSEINAELEISDAEDGQNDGTHPKGSQPHLLGGNERSSWKLIKSNKFMHRGRKSQTIDEIMVCHCKTPSNGKLGCGDGCLNRMLNIECVRGTCPCGESCSNQQFQKRKYAKLKWFRCGKKGYGLQLQEDISEGEFLIEYIGEVLDMQAYEARQRDYASLGHKHFYFMTLNGSEVIDACAKGNLGRFINHSCDPNCRTEKWMVNGEVCVGLFALKNLKKGEEVTFDYNYVRVFGAAAKKCVCGSSHCRGYIGGDPRNSEVIVQGDSDDEFPEPVMVYDDGEPDDSLRKLISITSDLDDPTASFTDTEKVLTCEDKMEIATIVENLEDTKELQLGDVLVNEIDKACESASNFHHLESEKLQISFEVMEKSAFVKSPIQLVDKKNLVSDLSDTKKKQKSEKIVKNRAPKSKTVMKISHLSSLVKKGKSTSTNSATLSKPENMVSKAPGLLNKSKKIIEGSVTARSEVEEKLNEVLDVEGGISKRQDAAQGYLKLLFLTAASGEANQSNRDLSLILGAIWKTKSRSVLVDVISKNGLQMLHNILKRCRRDFNKIPILRKLLKVLEFLATKEILTVELINKDPSHAGVESFRESILSLSEHDDKQVHQIARNFRDRWIPWSLRRNNDFHRGFNGNRPPSHNHWRERNSQTSDTVNDKNQSSPANVPVAIDTVMNETCSSFSGTQTRKRKSRWDQPAESNKQLKIQLEVHNLNAKVNDDCLEKRADGVENMDEDVPPGFAPPCNASSLPILNGFPFKVEIGQPQGKFMNRSSVSYGIPMPIVQQLGYPKTDNLEDWFIAPGVPFQPYPPLPSYKRNRYDDTRDYKGNNCQPNYNPPSTSAVNASNIEIQGTNNCHGLQKASSPHGMGRFYRQQKWNNSRLPPPWIRKHNVGGFMGNRMWGNRNGEEGGHMEYYPNPWTQNPQREGYH